MITTGITKLDELLGGGIRDSIITDIFGPSGTGKTQLTLQICVNSLTNNGIILYQDTSGGFRPERLLDLLKAKNMEPKLLDRVTVGRITNTAEQLSYIDKILEIKNISLVVIDNITDLFSFEYSKESNSLAKHIAFMKYMHKLALVTVQKKIPVVVTNIIRKSNDEERENLDRSISMFTHRKIRLTKIDRKYVANALPSFGSKKLAYYIITHNGLVDLP
ncbi:MAG TPA: ATPase domain-containing protein [Nitrosopumilaceae archaeon]|nr:ATPase domain-containing protein [Nitrosopumilaceae archaeon]